MPIHFHGSPSSTLGVELELGLVDLDHRGLSDGAAAVIDELQAGRGSVGEKVKHELFQCTVEVITGICDTVDDARRDLEGTLDVLRGAAALKGLGVIGSGTHPFTDWRDLTVSSGERYVTLVETLRWPARRLAIHGVHFHVGVPTGGHAIAVVQSLAVHLPLFLAASASSPFWVGADTGMASSRTKVFEGLPTAGLPPRLADWGEFEDLMGGLLHARVISSIREIWWDCRPHPDFGTVELRMCDGITNLDDAMALAALAQCVVADLVGRIDAGEPLPEAPEWVVRENKWLASRHGMDTSLIVDDRGNRVDVGQLVVELVDRVRPTADRLGCRADLERVVHLVERGPSYRRQRAMVESGATLVDLVDALVDEHLRGVR